MQSDLKAIFSLLLSIVMCRIQFCPVDLIQSLSRYSKLADFIMHIVVIIWYSKFGSTTSHNVLEYSNRVLKYCDLLFNEIKRCYVRHKLFFIYFNMTWSKRKQ